MPRDAMTVSTAMARRLVAFGVALSIEEAPNGYAIKKSLACVSNHHRICENIEAL
jgi:hypothetical protein